MYKISLIALSVILVFLWGVSPFLGNFLPTETCFIYFQGNQATENRHLKSDLPQVCHIYKSDHEGNRQCFLQRWDTVFVKGKDGVNLHQSLFWTQFWCFTAEAIKKVLISIKQEWDQVLRFIFKKSKKKQKNPPNLKKAVQSGLSLKSEHQEEQSTYASVRVKKNKNILITNIIYSSKMTLWQPFYVCISCFQ